jgi:hypothetical protein
MGLHSLLDELFQEGGVTVETPGARTVLQADGQLIVKVTPQVLAEPALWAAHQAALQQRLAPVTLLRSRLGRLGQVVRYVSSSPLLMLSDTPRESSVEMMSLELWTGLTFLIGPALGLVVSGVAWLLVYRARRYLERMLSQRS